MTDCALPSLAAWDAPHPFVHPVTGKPDHIEELGHANNAVYVMWLEECAWQHSASLGLTVDDYTRLNRAMAVLRHEIDYLASAYEGETLYLGTWIAVSDYKLRMKRNFQLRRADGKTLLRAQTTFVCIEMNSGKPKRMPEEFIAGYGKALKV